MHGATLTAASLTIRAQTASRSFQSGYVGKSRIYYEAHGDPNGKPFFLGYPIMASYGEIFGDRMAPIKTAYLNELTDRYRVLLVDYPTIGKSGTTPVTELTADRVCADLLAVAYAAGFKRFAYGGFLWGAMNGLVARFAQQAHHGAHVRLLASAGRAVS
jgi:pimeloyl-ACP methyl ester carboxylesterase